MIDLNYLTTYHLACSAYLFIVDGGFDFADCHSAVEAVDHFVLHRYSVGVADLQGVGDVGVGGLHDLPDGVPRAGRNRHHVLLLLPHLERLDRPELERLDPLLARPLGYLLLLDVALLLGQERHSNLRRRDQSLREQLGDVGAVEVALAVLPNPRELPLPVDLDLLGHCGESAVLDDDVLDLAGSSVEVLGELVVEVEGEDVGDCGHLHGEAVDVSVSELGIEPDCEVATRGCVSPAALPVEDQHFLRLPRIPHASAKQKQPRHSVPFCELGLEAVNVHVLGTHLHSCPFPAPLFLLAEHGLPVLEVAVVEADSIGPDPPQNRRHRLTSPLPTTIALPIPLSLPIAVRVALLWLVDHLFSFPYSSTTQVVARNSPILFPYASVSTSWQFLNKHLLRLEEHRQQSDQAEEQSHGLLN